MIFVKNRQGKYILVNKARLLRKQQLKILLKRCIFIQQDKEVVETLQRKVTEEQFTNQYP